jgi:hypothetical protein
MRDPNRIPQILERLGKLWKENPDLRLGQLIGNVYHYPSGIDPYFDEDETFIHNLEFFYRRTTPAPKG